MKVKNQLRIKFLLLLALLIAIFYIQSNLSGNKILDSKKWLSTQPDS